MSNEPKTTPMSDAALERLESELTSESRPVLIPAEDLRSLVERVRTEQDRVLELEATIGDAEGPYR